MKHDFVTVVDRSFMGSSKWEGMKKKNPDVPAKIIPFSVADMELKNPPEIMEGLKEALDSDLILGYTTMTPAYLEAVRGFMKRRHGWEIRTDWIVPSPGVVPALSYAVSALTEPGDGVIIMPPVYYPFSMVTEMNGRTLVENPLIDNGGRYEIDFEDLEEKAKNPNNRLLIFCSPHNPVGRVWTREELERVAEICVRNHVFVVSDEIHFDLIMPGKKHTVFAELSKEAAENCIVCTAPSKTFNLAGMQTSNLMIPNPEIRERMEKELRRNAFVGLGILGQTACQLAYERCDDWLNELLIHLDGNRRYVEHFLEEQIPQIKAYPLEGTYLMWLDFRGLGLSCEELENCMVREAYLFFDEGYIFGTGGAGFERMNIACPRQALEGAMNRLKSWADGRAQW